MCDLVDLSGRVKKIAKEKGISIAELERAVGVSPNSIHRWNNNIPSMDKIIKVAEVLETNVEFIINGMLP